MRSSYFFVAALFVISVCHAEHPGVGKVVELTDENFNSVVNGEFPTVLEFYAPWCPHCKEFASEYEALAKDLGTNFLVGRVDGDKFDKLADDFQVTGYPVIKLLKKGLKGAEASKAEEYEGSMRRSVIEDWVKANGQTTTGTQSHIQMHHLQPELENILSVSGRCYRSEKSMYTAH